MIKKMGVLGGVLAASAIAAAASAGQLAQASPSKPSSAPLSQPGRSSRCRIATGRSAPK